jgi:hypothetical protein
VSDHLNVVVNRAMTLLASPAFWLVAIALCVIQSLQWSDSGPRSGSIFMAYPVLLLVFTFRSTEVSSASPLLPYSRPGRAIGLLAANLLSLVLFFAFMWVTWRGSVLLGSLLNQDGFAMGRIHARDIVLAIMICVPAYFMAQLLLSVMRSGAVVAMTFAGMACVIATVATARAISASHQPGAEVHLLWWCAACWGLYLLLLYLRFTRGSLEQR